MLRKWMIALAGLALVAAVAVWLVRKERKKIPPEPITEPRAMPQRLPTKRVVQKPRSDCAPLPGGGFSCGACRNEADCPKGSSCVVNLGSGRTECQGSDCKKDGDCEKGAFCRVVGRTSGDEPLRACVPPGTRAPGAACDGDNGGDPSVSCEANLVCVEGGCADRCERQEPDDPRTCPGLHECVKTDAGWGCVPTCKYGQSCGPGKECAFLSVENPISLCTYMDGRNCLGSKGGCPANTDCIVETNARAERSTFRCMDRCDPTAATPTCPGGSVCVPDKKKSGHCRRGCGAGGEGQCGANERCVRAKGAAELWFCSAT